MGFEDWNKASKEAEKMKAKLNNGEIVHAIKLLVNGIDDKSRRLLVNLLKNTGFLEPLVSRDDPRNI